MKYILIIIQVIAISAIQIIGSTSLGVSNEGYLDGKNVVGLSRSSVPSLPNIIGSTLAVVDDEAEKPNGLHYDPDGNTWTLFATVLQIKKTSIYGRPGEIAQIEYSLDGKTLLGGWIMLIFNEYSFVDGDERSTSIEVGQQVQLYISGKLVSIRGVNWEECPTSNTYCRNASFIEGGFPKSEDYLGLSLCPSNTIILSGSLPDDWINGILAWRVKY